MKNQHTAIRQLTDGGGASAPGLWIRSWVLVA